MAGMFNPNTILLHILNAAILLTALYFLLLKPVRKFMDARNEQVNAQLQSVENAQLKLEVQASEARNEVASARKIAADTVAQGVTLAREQARKVVEEAHVNAEHILQQARAEADFMRKSARENMRGEVANLSVALAGKVLKREVTQEDHEKLIDDFLQKVV